MTARPSNVQYGFSSMGSPSASLSELRSLAQEFGMDFIELRALGGTVCLPDYFTANPISNPLDLIQPNIRLVATNLRLSEANREDIEDFLRFADVAVMLHAPFVRVFGGGQWGEALSQLQLEQAARTVEHCRLAIKEKSAACEILVETHSGFSSSEACLRLNNLLEQPLGILWDSHHTWRNAGETPEETWRMIGPLVRYMHFSDSRLKKSPETGYECILPGSGEYPVEALAGLLADVGYSGGVSMEWEKLWHPELPDIRLALKEFQRLMCGKRGA